jgi:hypothetical protein
MRLVGAWAAVPIGAPVDGSLRMAYTYSRYGNLSWPFFLAGEKHRNLHRAHLVLTPAAPFYHHLLVNVGEYTMSGGAS